MFYHGSRLLSSLGVQSACACISVAPASLIHGRPDIGKVGSINPAIRMIKVIAPDIFLNTSAIRRVAMNSLLMHDLEVRWLIFHF